MVTVFFILGKFILACMFFDNATICNQLHSIDPTALIATGTLEFMGEILGFQVWKRKK